MVFQIEVDGTCDPNDTDTNIFDVPSPPSPVQNVEFVVGDDFVAHTRQVAAFDQGICKFTETYELSPSADTFPWISFTTAGLVTVNSDDTNLSYVTQ